ncbi:MAG TPA: serine protease [Porphyromonadaceae bacterium]|nr:nodulation protein NfeD [Bacteroidales bacterium]HBC39379.1 serine protease [Porphyromonadaceae bacterium]HBF95758.1 serine protease [Porphyromonadaceae bacterium]HBK39978.1 serine protease [Porphyromonadaceae bacterium]HBQ56254.1 serine protease [Porphyromonadaceae bacterium]
MKNIRLIFVLFFILFVYVTYGQHSNPLIYKINIKENIGSNTWVYLQNGMHQALNKNADCILLHMNTYGGSVTEADSMRTAILNFQLPVYVFIDNNAASAGALISIACDSIFMRSAASIGAATVVSGQDGSKAPDKYQSYMRGMMRATAESHGRDTVIQNRDTLIEWKRDPKVAEAMVDEKIVIPGFADSTQILTLTASQAVELRYCDGIAENINQIAVQYLGYRDYDLETYNPTLYDRIKGLLMNGVLQAILIMLIIGGIYFELQTPGIGFPTAVAVTAALLYFTPLYLTGYAQNWEVLLFVLGLILIVFEIFVIPGFGVAGISGIILVFTALILALVGNIHFDFSGLSLRQLFRAIMVVFAGIGMGLALIIYMSSRIGKPGIFSRVALVSDQEGYVSVPMEPLTLVGQTGIASTVLRPSGKIRIGDQHYDAVSMKGFIEKGDEVVVKRYENFQLYVMKK